MVSGFGLLSEQEFLACLKKEFLAWLEKQFLDVRLEL